MARDALDVLIAEAVILRLASPAMREALRRQGGSADDSEALDAIRDDEQSLVELSADYYQHKRIGRDEFFSNRDAIEARIKSNRARVRQRQSPLLNLPDAEQALREHWAAADVEARREIVGAVVDVLTVNAGRRGARSLDPERIEVVWKA